MEYYIHLVVLTSIIVSVLFLFVCLFIVSEEKKHKKELEKLLEDTTEQTTLINRELAILQETNNNYLVKVQELEKELETTNKELDFEKTNNKKILSQKKSSETKLGQISEHLAPFLDECPYNPKHMHFLGQPIDFIVFDEDEDEIVFLEVKSGGSKESKKQKQIKNMITEGRVYYEKMRIGTRGVKIEREENE